MTMRKAIIYTRVSTGMQVENTSLEMQAGACHRKANELQAEVVNFYSDPGISGAKFYTRPGIQAALSSLRNAEADTLIIYKLDRAGRDMDIIRKIRKEVLRAGCTLIFADGMNFENNATGNLTFNVMAGFAEFERETIRERTMGGRQALAESGIQPNRALSPFGYHIVTKNEKIEGLYPGRAAGDYVLIEAEAHWVREIFRLYAGSWSMSSIARHLNDHSVPTPKGGKEWRASSVRAILVNPLYMGKVVYNKSLYQTDEEFTYRRDPSKKLKGGKRQVARPESEWTLVKTDLSPLVDQATWNLCAAKIAENVEEKQVVFGGNPHRKFLLSGLVFCPSCGWRIGGQTRPGGLRYYRCESNKNCTATRRRFRADQIEDLLIQSLQHLSKQATLVQATIEAYEDAKRAEAERGTHEPERQRLESDLKALEERGQAAAKAMTAAVMAGGSADDFTGILKEINTRRKTIEARLQTLIPTLRLVKTPSARDIAAKLAEVAGAIVKVFSAPPEHLSTMEKQALLLPIVDQIIPSTDGDAIGIRWKSETLHCVSIS